jgi:anti-anti-sigma factor
MQTTGPVAPNGRAAAGDARAAAAEDPGPTAGSGTTSAVWSLRAQGDIDIDHAPTLAGRLDDLVNQGAKVVLLDLSAASFLDSSGLRVIVRAGERLREHDGQLIIEGASGAVSRVLELTGLLEHYAAPADGSDGSDAPDGPAGRD